MAIPRPYEFFLHYLDDVSNPAGTFQREIWIDEQIRSRDCFLSLGSPSENSIPTVADDEPLLCNAKFVLGSRVQAIIFTINI
ncbi:MAG: hypothetical protein ACE5KV_06850 [Thermoplasmata archaeon]